MAGFWQTVVGLTKPFNVNDDSYIEGDEEEEINDVEEEPEEEEEEVSSRQGFGKRSAAPRDRDYGREYAEPPRKAAPVSRVSRPEVHTYAPVSFDEVSDIAQNLVDRRAVILNLEKTDPETAGRLRDFMSGVTFALDGQIRRIATQVYAFAPAGVDFIGFAVEESSTEYDGQYL